MALTETQQIYEALKNSQSPIITFKPEHDGDTIAAGLAFNKILRKMDKQQEIVSDNFVVPEHLKFFPLVNEIKPNLNNLRRFIISLNTTNTNLQKIDYENQGNKFNIILEPGSGIFTPNDLSTLETKYRHDLIITLGTPDLDSLKNIYEKHTDFFFSTPILNIDHSTENENFGHYNLVKVTATSVSEIVYDLLEEIDLSLLDEEIATYLLAGMIIKTKSFKTPQVTPKSLRIASELMAGGANREMIIRNLYQTKSVGILKLWGKALQKLEADNQQKIAWSYLDKEDFIATVTTPSVIPNIIEEMISNIPSIVLSVIFYETADNLNCIIKAENNYNLLEILQDYRPTGSKSLVKITLQDSTPQDIIFHLKTLLK